jgi:hypothetical protein
MLWSFSRSVAIGGICLMAGLAAGAPVNPAHAQMQQTGGFNALDPQWTLASPFMSAGFEAGSSPFGGFNQQAYTAKVNSGTVGVFLQSNSSATGPSGDLFGPSSANQQANWFASMGDPAWKTSTVFGSYKSNPDAALGGLYTTASFGVMTSKMNVSGFSGLPNFSADNNVAGVTARAGVGLQLTPQITIEGSVGVTQAPVSTLR